MNVVTNFMSGRYRECLNYPVYILLVMLGMTIFAGLYIGQFRFDASEKSLMPEGDGDLAYYRNITDELGGQDFLFMTYEPVGRGIFEQETLQAIAALERQLEGVASVTGVYSILDAPLLASPPVTLPELQQRVPTLRDPGVDLGLARAELTQSPVFSELLISRDGRTTAMRIDLAATAAGQPDDSSREDSLNDIRAIRDALPASVNAHLGGVPLVASDMIRYIRSDVSTFGLVVILLMAAMLYLIFRRIRWVVLPLVSTGVTVLITVGILGFFRQPTTVISSNFISLLSIITISFSIHLIARYRELRAAGPGRRHTDLVYDALRDKLAPCVYTALTTMVAFGSLMTSDIKPVADFGWIMCVGIVVSFFVTYSFFASLLLLMPKGKTSTTLHHEPALTRYLAGLAAGRTWLVLGVTAVSFLIALGGLGQISMDNRFIEYFRSNTEIHQGLKQIDEELGGTIPFDIIFNFEPFQPPALDSDNPFLDDVEPDPYPERYWFTPDKLAILEEMEQWLSQRPEIGKILSLSTLEQVGRTFNGGRPLGSVELVAALGSMPDTFRAELISPFAAPGEGVMRLSARLHETGAPYSHDELIGDIERHAVQTMGLEAENVRVTGMAVFFNKMLMELFASQQSTILFVIAATFVMFVLLLRSVTFALLGLIPNILAAISVLAIMGFAGIPLDIMSITIAAIIIGIGVDDAIHYLHRFKQEFDAETGVRDAVRISHASIGDALYYTSFTVIIGFSVLGLSNFMPTVYFGLLTALAMLLAMLANLTILPALLVLVYGRKTAAANPIPN